MSRRAPIYLSLYLAALAATASPVSGDEHQPLPDPAGSTAPAAAASTPPDDPSVSANSYTPEVGDWVVLQPGTILQSSAGQRVASPQPATYMVHQVKDVGTTKWCWLVGDASGWVTSEVLVPPIDTFQSANNQIQSSSGQDSVGQVDSEQYVLRGLFEQGQPLRGTPAKNGPAEADAAIADFTEALRLNPSDMYAHYFLAKAYEGRAIPRDELALAELMESIRLDSHFLPSYYDRAHVFEILAIRLWLQEIARPEGDEAVPSARVLTYYRRAYDDLNTVVSVAQTFADPRGTFATARDRLKNLASRVTQVENWVEPGVLVAAVTHTQARQIAPAFASAQGSVDFSPQSDSGADGQTSPPIQKPPYEWVKDVLNGRPDLPPDPAAKPTGQTASSGGGTLLQPVIAAPSKAVPMTNVKPPAAIGDTVNTKPVQPPFAASPALPVAPRIMSAPAAPSAPAPTHSVPLPPDPSLPAPVPSTPKP